MDGTISFQSLTQMGHPSTGKAMPYNTDSIYYVVLDGQSAGSFLLTELPRLMTEKKIMEETYVWKLGMAQWNLVENVSEVPGRVALTPPPLPVVRCWSCL